MNLKRYLSKQWPETVLRPGLTALSFPDTEPGQ